MDDWDLLNEYATRDSGEAFRQLVDRYAGMVYHTALRQVRNPQVAQDATQMVFIALARKAGRIPRRTLLYGWLFRATRYAVAHLVREDARRRRYEKEAAFMERAVESHEAEAVWDQISPYLNDALDRLPKLDREVVLIRYFGNKSHREVAQALGLTEDTAKKRLSRALERLRAIFARRGVAVPSMLLVAAFSACGAQAAPVGLSSSIAAAALAQGAGAIPALALAKVFFKLFAWAKANATVAVGAGVLLTAAGTATVAVNVLGRSADDLIRQLEHSSRKRIAWDKHLTLSAGLDLQKLPLEQALDDLSVHSGAYWTVDYAIYASDQGLRRLLDCLHEATELEPAGWTNLSARLLRPNILIEPFGQSFGGSGGGAGISGGGGIAGNKPVIPDLVSMRVVLQGKALTKWQEDVQQNLGRRAQGDQNVSVIETEESAVIRAAMREGVLEGVLAPERLLAETRLASSIDPEIPSPATPETADRYAKAARARWATIYTLRKSPLEGAGIKLLHSGMGNNPWGQKTNQSFDEFIQSTLTNRFNLNPEARAAHDRAVEAFKNRK